MDYKLYFEEELKNEKTQYFIFDSKGTVLSGLGDVEFTGYVYDLNKFSLPKEGDLFIYRRPLSKIAKKFYFYGACKIEKIENITSTRVRAVISKPYQFVDSIYQGDTELESIDWLYKNRPVNSNGEKHWQYMFNQYGMTKITKDDFNALMDIQNPASISSGRSFSSLKLETQFYQQMIQGNYAVENPTNDLEMNDACNRAYSRRVKECYNYKCAITGNVSKDVLKVKRFKKGKSTVLDPSNGICLRKSLANALKKGFISFDDNYALIVSSSLEAIDPVQFKKFSKYEGKKINVSNVSLLPKLEYIKYHRTKVFKK